MGRNHSGAIPQQFTDLVVFSSTHRHVFLLISYFDDVLEYHASHAGLFMHLNSHVVDKMPYSASEELV